MQEIKMNYESLVLILVSEQTIPNVQFLKWYVENSNYDASQTQFLFVSTNTMEQKNKSDDIMAALNSKATIITRDNHRIIEVHENSLEDIEEKLQAEIKVSFSKIIANITGGTKIMSLATYQICAKLTNSEIYYQPIGQKLLCLKPTSQEVEGISSTPMTIDEHMKAAGVGYQFIPSGKFVKTSDFTNKVHKSLFDQNRASIIILLKLQNNKTVDKLLRNGAYANFSELPKNVLDECNVSDSYINMICTTISNFEFDPEKLTRQQIRYITGGWFEEYSYHLIKQEQSLDDNFIALGVNISKGVNTNELDVIYVDSKNRLNIVECKTSVDGVPSLLTDTLYKMRTIQKNFGLFTESHFYTEDIIDKQSAIHRAKDFNISIRDKTSLS